MSPWCSHPNGSAIYFEERAGAKRIVLENDQVRAAFLPRHGGKMASLVSLHSGREFLLQAGQPSAPPEYGQMFAQANAYGFDECVPTIAACGVAGPNSQAVQLPDHGEVWSVPWGYEIGKRELLLVAAGTRLQYEFHKKVSLDGAAVLIHYELRNASSTVLKYLWSAHPLLAVEPGAEIVLPPEVTEVLIGSSAGGRLGAAGDSCAWPTCTTRTGDRANLGVVTGVEKKTADKLFSPRLREGYAAIRFPRTAESLVLRFEPQLVPYLGVWICQGGWPAPGSREFTVALEPCTGRPDSLAEAIQRNEAMQIMPHNVHSWTLRMEVVAGTSPSPEPAKQVRL